MGKSKNSGYIKLFRKITTWEWYSDPATRDLFIHCLLMANWEPGTWQGHPYKRGEFFTSHRKLANELGYTVRQTRTALKHLQMTHEVTLFSTSKYTLISINNYDEYQENDTQSDNQSALSVTHEVTTDKEDKNIRINNLSLMLAEETDELLQSYSPEALADLEQDVRDYYENHSDKTFPGWIKAIKQFDRNQKRWRAGQPGQPRKRKNKSTEDLIRELQAEEEQQ